MDNLLSVTLEAQNPAMNHYRRYEIRVGQDLFGDWTVAVRYGRIGQQGQEIRHACADPAPLRQFIRQCLHRRLSAPKRIGCRYTVTGLSAGDLKMAREWLPAAYMTEFECSLSA